MNTRTYNVIEVFYRKNGIKKSILCMNKDEAGKRRSKLMKQKRKFLGQREVTLVEQVN